MAINPTSAAYITNQPDTNAAVVDIDIKGAENDSNRSSGRALVVTISGTLNPDGSYSPGFSGGGGGSSFNGQVQGNVAAGQTDTGNPVKIGGLVSAGSPPNYLSGQRGDIWLSSNGALVLAGVANAPTDAMANGAILSPAAQNGNGVRSLSVASQVFNGTTWDRQRGDVNGTYSVSKGSGGIATTQAAVTTSASQIVAARSGRGSVKITNLGTTDIYIGVSGVTTTTGDLLVGTKGASVTIPTSAAVFAVGAAAGSVSILEVF